MQISIPELKPESTHRLEADSVAFPPGSTADDYGFGLTKREYFASAALQGLLSGMAHDFLVPERLCGVLPSDSTINKFFAEEALRMADALLSALDMTRHHPLP
jgi:hypothetical protein